MKNVKKSAVIISALLLVCAVLFTGCPNGAGGAKPPTGSAGSSGGGSQGANTTNSQNVRVSIQKGAHVTNISPDPLIVGKGSKWNDIKVKVTVDYETGYEFGAWQFKDGGAELKDTDVFNADTIIFVSSKKNRYCQI